MSVNNSSITELFDFGFLDIYINTHVHLGVVTPLIPLLPPNHRLQRALNIQQLPQRTFRKCDRKLVLLIERIVFLVQRILEVLHTTVRMQLLPRPCALPTFAALKREQQAVEAGGERGDGPGVDG